MTGQILKVTTTPYQSVRISQSARLVPSDSLDLERRKAIARMKAFQSQHSSGGAGSVDINYVKQINRAFSAKTSQTSTAPSSKNSNTASESVSNSSGRTPAISNSSANEATASPETVAAQAVAADTTVSPEVSQAAVTAEADSAYTVDRGAFEFRVAQGELSFLPPLVMTIMTQRPEVHFEYIGGHNYVPPDSFDDNGFMNLLV
ncbi:MAG: hypothetical protein HFI68_05245 [Lachnospiraceae bacterium]|nr:hypothetical protein [Lachnospiraceae bacterium]